VWEIDRFGLAIPEKVGAELPPEHREAPREPDDDAGVHDAAPRLRHGADHHDDRQDSEDEAPRHDHLPPRGVEQAHAKGQREDHLERAARSSEVNRTRDDAGAKTHLKSAVTLRVSVGDDGKHVGRDLQLTERPRKPWLERMRRETPNRVEEQDRDTRDAPHRDELRLPVVLSCAS
jgi:hypothetical protein